MAKKRIKIVLCAIMMLVSSAAFAGGGVDIIDDDGYSRVLHNLQIDEDEVSLYRDIFAAIEAEKHSQATKLMKQCKNKIIFGHMLAEQYLSKKYVSKYAELKNWLQKYSGYPQ